MKTPKLPPRYIGNPTHVIVELANDGWLLANLSSIAAVGFDGDEVYWLSMTGTHHEVYMITQDAAACLLDLLDMTGKPFDTRTHQPRPVDVHPALKGVAD